MGSILISWLVLAISVGVAVQIVPGVRIEGGLWQLLLVAAVFGLVGAVLRPILNLFSLPLIVLTLGLFTLVINLLLFLLTAWIMPSLKVDGFWHAFLASLVMSIVGAILGAILES